MLSSAGMVKGTVRPFVGSVQLLVVAHSFLLRLSPSGGSEVKDMWALERQQFKHEGLHFCAQLEFQVHRQWLKHKPDSLLKNIKCTQDLISVSNLEKRKVRGTAEVENLREDAQCLLDYLSQYWEVVKYKYIHVDNAVSWRCTSFIEFMYTRLSGSPPLLMQLRRCNIRSSWSHARHTNRK